MTKSRLAGARSRIFCGSPKGRATATISQFRHAILEVCIGYSTGMHTISAIHCKIAYSLLNAVNELNIYSKATVPGTSNVNVI
jgi:hypothetical protein